MYCLSSTQLISASNCKHMCDVGLQAKKEYDSDDEEDAKKTEVVEDPGTLNDEYRWCLSLDFCGSKIVRYCQYSSARLFKWRQPLISKTSPTSLESPSRSIALLHPSRYFVFTLKSYLCLHLYLRFICIPKWRYLTGALL